MLTTDITIAADMDTNIKTDFFFTIILLCASGYLFKLLSKITQVLSVYLALTHKTIFSTLWIEIKEVCLSHCQVTSFWKGKLIVDRIKILKRLISRMMVKNQHDKNL